MAPLKDDALQALTNEAHALAVNFLRVLSGAGRPRELQHQMESYLAAYENFAKETGRNPQNSEIHRMFDWDHGLFDVPSGQPEKLKMLASSSYDLVGLKSNERSILIASIRMAASKYLGDKVQEGRAANELFGAISARENIRTWPENFR